MSENNQNELEALKKENQELKTQILYLQAELDNMRKLIEKEIDRTRQEVFETTAMKLIEFYEGLERALKTVKNGEDDSFIKGVKLLHKELEKTLREMNVAFLDTIGKKFDPFIHEAVGYVTNAELEDGTIIAEVSRGYMIKNKLLRPAKVIIVKNQTEENKS